MSRFHELLTRTMSTAQVLEGGEIAANSEDLEEYVLGLKQRIAALEARFTVPIVCMCGSTRFKQAWIAENARLTSDGNIVLAVGLWGHHEQRHPSPEEKIGLDNLHKRKIDLCNWVWVLDIGGYIGDSTRSEIEYAISLGRPVRYLSQEFPAYQEPIDSILARAEQAERERDELVQCLTPFVKDRAFTLLPDGCKLWVRQLTMWETDFSKVSFTLEEYKKACSVIDEAKKDTTK